MPEEVKTEPPMRRRPALLLGLAAVTGCTFANSSIWFMVLGAILLVVSAVLSGRARTLAACLGVVLAFSVYAGWQAEPATDSLLVIAGEGADVVRLEGLIVEGGQYVQRDPAAFEYPDSPQPETGFPISADPRRNQSMLLKLESLPDTGLSASGYVKLYVPPDVDVPLFSKVSVIGKLRRPRRAGNVGEVDSRERYQRRGISHTLTIKAAGQITILEPPTDWNWRRIGPSVHEWFHTNIGQKLPQGRAAILGALLLGERGNLSAAQRQRFVRSGTVHLLVVSGLHVGLLVGVILFLLRCFGIDPRVAWPVGAGFALTYLLITGVQPSVLRATIMICLYALGRMLLRKPDPLNILGAAAFITLIISPSDVFELGFQLSYLAVLGLLVVGPSLRFRKPKALAPDAGSSALIWRWLKGSLRASVAVGLCTWPLLAASVHVVSPSMVFTNLIATPIMFLLLVLGLLSPLAAIPGLDIALATSFSLLTGLLDGIAQFFASIPYGHLFLPSPPTWWLATYYVGLFSLYFVPRIGGPRVLAPALWLASLALLPALSLVYTEPPGPVRLTTLDVGQGQCCVMEIPSGPCVIFDCGSTSLGGVGERVLAPYLWERGRTKIDAVFISHADADHVNGLPQLLERFEVGRFFVAETFEDDETGRELVVWLSQYANVEVLHRGQVVEFTKGVRVRCMWPDAGFVRELISERNQRNEGGFVLMLEAGKTRAAISGDVENAAWLETAPDKTHLLFAPHQGSRVNGLDAILNRLKPETIIISARSTFPPAKTVQRYDDFADTYKTWQHGAITAELWSDGRIDYYTFR